MGNTPVGRTPHVGKSPVGKSPHTVQKSDFFYRCRIEQREET